MLQLLAGEDQPGAEHHVTQVGVDHREEHVVDLKGEADHVEQSVAGVPRVEGLDRQPRNLHRNAGVRFVVHHHLDAVPEEGDRGPGGGRGHGGQHHQEEQLPHLGQSDRVVAGI